MDRGTQIATNVGAPNAYRNLSTTQNDVSKSLEKLSSGLQRMRDLAVQGRHGLGQRRLA